MRSTISESLYEGIRARELNGPSARTRKFVGESVTSISEIGSVVLDYDDEKTPPLAISFCKTKRNAAIFAMAKEDGYVSLFNSKQNYKVGAGTGRWKLCEWDAHQNAIFDMCWIKDDSNLLTASGDQSIKLWDVEDKQCISVLESHTGSVKSLSVHPTNNDILLSGSRDGSFALWDLRCNANSSEPTISPISIVQRAHSPSRLKRSWRGKATSMGVTSVLYLKDEVTLASAGASDSVIKFWDARNLKTPLTQICPCSASSEVNVGRLRGVSSLSQDSTGASLTAACMDNRIYLYHILNLDNGPIQSFSGCRIDTFYVKTAISPNGEHILSGSSDGSAYLWQVNHPDMPPVKADGHDNEVTAVDWSAQEPEKFATCSDDFTVRVWNMQTTRCISSKARSTRRRVELGPVMEETGHFDKERNLNTEVNLDFTEDRFMSCPSQDVHPSLVTPEAKEKRMCFSLGCLDRTPEATESPSSVLNLPPSSSKRKTILDYYGFAC